MNTSALNRGVRFVGGRTLVFLVVLAAFCGVSLGRDAKSANALAIVGVEFSLDQPRIVLDGISPREITGSGPRLARDMGSWGETKGRESRQLLPEIIRDVPALWRAKLPNGKAISNLQVGFQIIADNGHVGCLSNVSRPDSEIRLRIQATPPMVANSEGGWAFLEGGAAFFLSFEGAREAGEYSGTLTVTVSQP